VVSLGRVVVSGSATGSFGSDAVAAHIDLHLHSTFSDGRNSVEELVELALADETLSAAALTDHDSGNGVELFRRKRDALLGPGSDRTLKVIEGIEVSAEWGGRIVHILGYFPEGRLKGAKTLREFCRENVEKNRLHSVLRFGPEAALDRLRRRRRELLGEEPSFDRERILHEVEARYRALVEEAARAVGGEPLWPVPPGGRLWREAMVERGVAPVEVLECFVARDREKEKVLRKYWEKILAARAGRPVSEDEKERIREIAREDRGFILEAEKSDLEAVQALRAIREGGGIPVLAHPFPSLQSTPFSVEKAVEELAASGLGGVEVYYPLHDENHTAALLALASALNLVVTGGTDHHGKTGQVIGDLGGGRTVPYLPLVDLLGV